MNCYTYIFGELSNGYTQYPADSSFDFFKEILTQCDAPVQFIIHRDEGLMYYLYVRKFDGNHLIGFANIIKGYYLKNLRALFDLFEKNVEALSEKGKIIRRAEGGGITSSLGSFSDEAQEIISVVDALQSEVESMAGFEPLPLTDSDSISSQKIFSYSHPESEIVDASWRFGFTVVQKEETAKVKEKLAGFRNILKKNSTDKFSLVKEIESLREVNKTIRRQKNNLKILFLFVLCVIGVVLLYFSLNDANVQLDVARRTINEKDVKIENRDHRISTLRDSVKSLKEDVEREKSSNEKLESKLQTVMSYYPFAVTKCEVNNSRFKFDYYCTQEKEVTVTLKAINETSGEEVITGTYTLKFNEGTGSKELIYNNTLNGWCDYYVVLIYNGNVIAGKDW